MQPESVPLRFKLDGEAAVLSQADLEFLSAAFESQSQAAPMPRRPSGVGVSGSPRPTTGRGAVQAPVAVLPPWSGYEGAVNVSLGELRLSSGQVLTGVELNAQVSEPALIVEQIVASLEGGKVVGSGSARFSSALEAPYSVESALRFENFDPALFTTRRSGASFVQGIFDGEGSFVGAGASLEEALEAAEGQLEVTGREGLLTAFDLKGGVVGSVSSERVS